MELEVFDLLILEKDCPLVTEQKIPAWVYDALQQFPLVVVRRGIGTKGVSLIPIGIRGKQREQRFGCWVKREAVQRAIKPEHIMLPYTGPYAAALQQIKEILHPYAIPWGPTGSVGYQLAAQIQCTHVNSDLDLLLKPCNKVSVQDARIIYAQLRPIKPQVDAVLYTGKGFLVLEEYACQSPPYLMKTQAGAALFDKVWMERAYG